MENMYRADLNATREPSVYIQSTLDSYLEKKSSGVRRSKTKVRCWLHGSMLYEQKDQDVKFHDLREAQTVRKVANDPTGTQFEIVIKKKAHTYICSSSEDCKSWVTALQKCMMFKDSSLPTSDSSSQSMFYTGEDSDVYTEIGDSNPQLQPASNQSSETDNDHYCTPFDAVETLIHNDYEEVELRKSSLIPEIQNETNSSQEPMYNDYTDGVSDQAKNSEPYSQVVKLKKNEPIDGLSLLSKALDDCEAPVSDLPHSLTSEEISCLKVLKQYMRTNKAHCTPCALKASNIKNPLAALKTCLESLNIN